MSPEFSGSSKNEQSKLYSLSTATLLGFAENSTSYKLLEKLQNILAERALAEEFNLETDAAAIFVYTKLEKMRQDERDDIAAIEQQVREMVAQDQAEQQKFFEIYPYYFTKDEPEAAIQEDARIALFKKG